VAAEAVYWPSDIVDASQLHELLGYGTRDPGVMGDAGASQVRRLDHVLEQAHQRQLIRQVRLLSGDREIVARGYRRAPATARRVAAAALWLADMPDKRGLTREHRGQLRRRALEALESDNELRRAKAVFVLYPCNQPGRDIEERVLRLRSDRSHAVRKALVHVYPRFWLAGAVWLLKHRQAVVSSRNKRQHLPSLSRLWLWTHGLAGRPATAISNGK